MRSKQLIMDDMRFITKVKYSPESLAVEVLIDIRDMLGWIDERLQELVEGKGGVKRDD